MPRHLLEDAERRVQRGQLNIDRQREVISALERDGEDATKAKPLLKLFEKAHAIRLIKELEKSSKARPR